MPSKLPSSVASTMPTTATRSVLSTPAAKAFQYGSSASKGMTLSPMSKPAGCHRKSKPLRMPRACMLASVLCARYHRPPATRATASTW